jgi:hypothetical protein
MEEIVWLKLMIPESCMELWTQSCAAQEWIWWLWEGNCTVHYTQVPATGWHTCGTDPKSATAHRR